jgi:putative DNA primase/helicase
MILEKEMTALNPPVSADGGRSPQICNKESISEAATENKGEIDTSLWFDGKNINEAVFCADFLTRHKLIFSSGSFFTVDGRVVDETPLRRQVFDELKTCATNNIPRKISNILEIMKLVALVEDFVPDTDRIYVQNGTLRLDGTFSEGKPEIVRNRLPVPYQPKAPAPRRWLSFLNDLLHPEDIPTLQEFIGYCLIPSNKGQRMMIMKGKGGEGKSQIGAVLAALFGCNMKDGSIGKISENRFARADLEHILLCVDDDMRMDALRQTNYVKSLVTAQGKMDLEKKGKQSYQGWMYARLLAFSNGDLQALFDRSDGFYRRQLVLEVKEKPDGRRDDPHLAEKLCAEIEGIFLWAFQGLQRLVENDFAFSESDRSIANREAVKRSNNNIFDFMDSEGYIRLKADYSVSSKDLYEIYKMWCEENSMTPLKARSFTDGLIANQKRYGLEHCNNITNSSGRRVWGFMGIEALVRPNEYAADRFSPCTYVHSE